MFTEVGVEGQISGKFCTYLLPGCPQEELSTSLKKSVYIESRMGTSTSFDSGIAGLSSTSQFTSSSQLDGMYRNCALFQVTLGTHFLLPTAARGTDQRLQTDFHLLKPLQAKGEMDYRMVDALYIGFFPRNKSPMGTARHCPCKCPCRHSLLHLDLLL